MSANHSPLLMCPNCDASLQDIQPEPAHCPRCGQSTVLHAPTFFEFVHEFTGHYVALEGALWRTLGNLFFLPGRLTREYLAGRRGKYVLPLRLYISVSFLFFVIVKVFGNDGILNVNSQLAPPSAASAPSMTQQAHLRRCLETPAACDAVDRLAARMFERTQGMQQADGTVVSSMNRQMMSMAPYAALAMQPVFAGLMQWVYRRRKRPYGEHFLFSLHMHAFWFLALLLASLLPSAVADGLLLLLLPHALVAMQRVYGGQWWVTSLRWTVLLVAYGVVLSLATLGLIVGIVLV